MAGQFEFLNRMRKERRVVSLYLVSGIRFLGRVVSFDREGLLLDTKHGQLLFQQRQISTIGPDLPKARTPRTASDGSERSDRPERAPRLDRPDRPDRPYGDPMQAPMRREPMVMREPGMPSGPGAAPRPAVQITRKPRREFVRDPKE